MEVIENGVDRWLGRFPKVVSSPLWHCSNDHWADGLRLTAISRATIPRLGTTQIRRNVARANAARYEPEKRIRSKENAATEAAAL
jgi:hypothetical protein